MTEPGADTVHVVRPAPRRPLQFASVAAMVAACGIGVARSQDEAMVLAVLAGLAAIALLLLVVKWNRPTLPLALVAGAVPALLAMRTLDYPAYEVAACGVLLVACGELAARSWYVHSLAPRGPAGGWTGATAVVLGAGALAGAGVMAAARARLEGAIVLTAIGAAAIVVAGVVAARTGRR